MQVNPDGLKRILIGRPFPTSASAHERLDKVRGLAIFASDPISSNAYATEAIMHVLIVLGSGALAMTMPIALGIAALIALVCTSYVQTIHHYPHGGGAYSVAKDNLGPNVALFAAAALMTDYVLTVSVSVAAGIRAVTSAFPDLVELRLPLAIAAVLLIAWINLRGVRESGTVFAFPTYAFVAGVLVTIGLGLSRMYGLFGLPPLDPHPVVLPASVAIDPWSLAYTWLLLRAFAAGCTALTGIEAISNGVTAFRKPEARNAATTMVWMAVIAMTLFIGISWLATHMALIPTDEGESILSQMTNSVSENLSGGRVLYYWVQTFTALILLLAANTGYQDFPRLGFFLARDGYMPRWMQNRGDRLVYSSGILLLTFIAGIVLVIFNAEEIRMLPLYAIGVMISFTLSQAGMVVLWGKVSRLKPGETMRTEVTTLHHERNVVWKRVLNATGALVTGIVLVVITATKFLEGAWIIALLIPLFVWAFLAIHRHYGRVADMLSTNEREDTLASLTEVADVVIVPIPDVHRGTLRALKYAKKLSPNVRAVAIITDDDQQARILRRWARFPELTKDEEIHLINYDYRDIIDRLVEYIIEVSTEEFPNQLVTVVVPEFIPRNAIERLLHNQTANMLRRRLHAEPNIVVIDIHYHV
ncbi:MAG: APC family permease [Ardenticatenales bacterium]|jgi:amino acid transporter|nr:APC family permease [Ardenticatenales bacterium]